MNPKPALGETISANTNQKISRELVPNLVSIITPAYNSLATIKETIQSVLAQSYSQWELLIVIDSGTTDQTPEVVSQYSNKDPRIQLLRVPTGKGLALSRNYALTQSRGQYIAFLDSDDLWLPKKLQKQLQFLKLQKAAFATHQFRRLSFNGQNTGHLIDVPDKIVYKDLLLNNRIGCLTVLIDQTQTGPLKFEETKHEDFLLWLDLLRKNYACVGLKQDLARYRIVPSSRSANKLEMFQMRWKILRQHEKISFFTSLYYLLGYAATSLQKYKRF